MRKASYTERKLTREEQVIAEENYYLLSYFMKKYELDFREWSDILSIPYIQAIKKYTDYERLHCYSIKTIILKSLDGAKANHIRKMTCAKRKPQGGSISFDKDIEYTFIPIVRNRIITLENEAISNLMAEMIFKRLQDQQQKEILRMLIEGYKKIEIQRELNISYYHLQKNIKFICEDVRKQYVRP